MSLCRRFPAFPLLLIASSVMVSHESMQAPAAPMASTSTNGVDKLIATVRELKTSVNYYSGHLWKMDGSIANQSTLAEIDRNLNYLRKNVRGLEGYIDKVERGQKPSGPSALAPLPDHKSAVGNPPRASSLVRSGKLNTVRAREWLLKASDFLQSAVKILQMHNPDDTHRPSGNQAIADVHG